MANIYFVLMFDTEAWQQKLPGRCEKMSKMMQIDQFAPEYAGKIQFEDGRQTRVGVANSWRSVKESSRLRDPASDYQSPVGHLYASHGRSWDPNNNPPSETAPNPGSNYQRSSFCTRGKAQVMNCKSNRCRTEENFYYPRRAQRGNSAAGDCIRPEVFRQDVQIPKGNQFHMIDINSNPCSPFTWRPYSEQEISGSSKFKSFERNKNPYHYRRSRKNPHHKRF